MRHAGYLERSKEVREASALRHGVACSQERGLKVLKSDSQKELARLQAISAKSLQDTVQLVASNSHTLMNPKTFFAQPADTNLAAARLSRAQSKARDLSKTALKTQLASILQQKL